MSLTYGILGFLSYGSMTGYDLAKAFSCSVNFFWNAQTSQIYRELGRAWSQANLCCRRSDPTRSFILSRRRVGKAFRGGSRLKRGWPIR